MSELGPRRVFNVREVRQDFPILQQEINGNPLVYLDNAATTQKPNCVIDAVCNYYRTVNANVHRGAHTLSDRATQQFEDARKTVATFIGSRDPHQVIWTRGTTESINLVAQTWGRANLKPGDKILVSALEHHSNIVPWQLVAAEKGAEVIPIPVLENGEVDLPAYNNLLDSSVKLVSVAHVSNALGTVNPVADIIHKAKQVGALTMIDGAQAVAHYPLNVEELGCDFYAFSGHKIFGPMGIGVLWGNAEILNAMPPFQGGGEMIETVRFEGTTFNQLPFKFEAGTPDVSGVIGLAAAIDYLTEFDRQDIIAHEHALLQFAHEKAQDCRGLRRVGYAKNTAGVMSFLINDTHPADLGMLLDQQGVAVRTGHHCAQPLMECFGIPGTVRASFSIYNTFEDVEKLFVAIEKAKTFLV